MTVAGDPAEPGPAPCPLRHRARSTRAGPDLATALAERPLAFAWMVLAVAALAAGAVFAAIVAAGRTPGLGRALAMTDRFAPALVMHVCLVTLVWMFAVMSALWTALLPGDRSESRAALGASLGAAVLLLLAWWRGAPAVLSNYVPVLADPLFVTGLAMMGVAALVTSAGALLAGTTGAVSGSGPARCGQDGAWVLGLRLTALQPALVLCALALTWPGVQSAGPFAGLTPHAAAIESLPLIAERLFWPAGHALQFAYVLLAMSCWLWLLRRQIGEGWPVRASLVMAALPALAVPVLLSLMPAGGAEARRSLTVLMQLGAWPGAVWLVGIAARALVRRGWRDADTGEWAAYASMALFVIGLLVGTLIRGDSTMVPAHYHGTIGAATLAAIAVILAALRRVPLAARVNAGRHAALLARGHRAIVLLYGAGFGLLVMGLAIAGAHEAPRKMPGVRMTDGNPAAMTGLMLMAVGALAAVTAVWWLAGLTLRVLMARRRSLPAMPGQVPTPPRPQPTGSVRPAGKRPWLSGLAAVDRRWSVAGATVLLVVLAGGLFAAWPSSNAGAGPDAAAAPIASAGRLEVADRFRQGVVMLHARQHGHALTAFHRVLQLEPRMPEAHANMGFALLGLGRPAQARDFFESAIELRREQMNAYYGLAVALEALTDVNGAIGAMRTYTHLAREDDPYLPKARAALWEWEQRAPLARR